MVWHDGYSEPPWHGLHQQRCPSAYQQARVLSLQVVPALGGVLSHAAGSGSTAQTVAFGVSTVQLPESQRAAVRHSGRGSSPQLQWALMRVLSPGGVGQMVPSAGGVLGQ
jgi:hypothetical protein